jgi:hypothetical protein
MKFFKYLLTSPDKKIWFWAVLIVSLIVGIGAISQGAVIFGVLTILIMNSAFIYGSYQNFKGKEW